MVAERLIPYLDPADRRELLAPALVSALAFVNSQLDRLDLVGDLMPFVQEELDRSADAVRDFVRSRFPGHGPGFLLDATELAALNGADHAEYVRLLGLPPTAAEAEAALTGPDAESILTEVILRPGLQRQPGRTPGPAHCTGAGSRPSRLLPARPRSSPATSTARS